MPVCLSYSTLSPSTPCAIFSSTGVKPSPTIVWSSTSGKSAKLSRVAGSESSSSGRRTQYTLSGSHSSEMLRPRYGKTPLREIGLRSIMMKPLSSIWRAVIFTLSSYIAHVFITRSKAFFLSADTWGAKSIQREKSCLRKFQTRSTTQPKRSRRCCTFRSTR